MTGQRIGNYEVVRKIGQGGMGAVYEAFHTQIGRQAAIKILRADLTSDPETARRFLNEARAVNLVHHPAVVSVFEFGQIESGAAFIVMEYLRGETLRDRLRSGGGRLPITEVLHLARQMASALSAVHAQGIVHRDLKPANVMIVPDPETVGGERVKIFDFGVAKLAVEQDASDPLTQAGTVMGTPTYMAPEQCRNASAVDAKADVYSLGAMLYQCIAGRPPFTAPDMASTIAAHLLTPPPPLQDVAPVTVPAELAALLHAMLAKDPAARPTMSRVAAELERLGAPRESGWALSQSLREVAPRPWPSPGPLSRPPTFIGTSSLRVRSRRALGVLLALPLCALVLTVGLRPKTPPVPAPVSAALSVPVPVPVSMPVPVSTPLPVAAPAPLPPLPSVPRALSKATHRRGAASTKDRNKHRDYDAKSVE